MLHTTTRFLKQYSHYLAIWGDEVRRATTTTTGFFIFQKTSNVTCPLSKQPAQCCYVLCSKWLQKKTGGRRGEHNFAILSRAFDFWTSNDFFRVRSSSSQKRNWQRCHAAAHATTAAAAAATNCIIHCILFRLSCLNKIVPTTDRTIALPPFGNK